MSCKPGIDVSSVPTQRSVPKRGFGELEGGRRVTAPQAGSVDVHTASATCTIWGTIQGNTSSPPTPGSPGWQHWQLSTAQVSVIEAFGPMGKGLFYVENCSGFWRNNFSLRRDRNELTLQ